MDSLLVFFTLSVASIYEVLFSSLVALGGPSPLIKRLAPPCEEGCPFLFIELPIIKRTKVGFYLGSENPTNACMDWPAIIFFHL